MRIVISFFILSLLSIYSPAAVMALNLGQNISIADGNASTSNSWYTGTGSASEDQEVEPGMIRNQAWDLEGFFLDHHLLSMVGGFDFKNGLQGYSSGDIFIALDQAPAYGDIHRGGANTNKQVSNSYGYDFAIQLDFTDGSYQVLELSASSQLETAYYQQNEGSSPWRYVSGGVELTSGQFLYQLGLSDQLTGFSGGNHYALTGIDLSFLEGKGENFFAHFTMGCGNDNLMGYAPVPAPEPSTLVLFACAGIALWRVKRRR